MVFRNFFLIFILLLTGCATVVNKTPTSFPKEKVCVVLPFVNYSTTPLAGEKAASIVYGVLKSKGYRVKKFFDFKEEDFSSSEVKDLIEKAKESGYKCVIGGYVNEWQYKVGVDGEPTVSLTIYAQDLGSKKNFFVITLSATGWGYGSVSSLTQKLINKNF
ncbi:MAG: hypothetical protein ABGX27_08480 [Desulfurobacteriaceae bacterium]